ncbi:hypothetical protein A2276_03275 [candidate division WOR-1 bacterium RIFOXYA12_FULL_43_27]|uniref:Lipoprotein n=1 Tax=candidate division WOR-1 bacterium RIFOXYC2_FULL_46_14 TaxID=1802587 RepID=A0A1F4U7D7_UNCSA|nr:MAG: hypothetical protein A2276_03275 [candidate division WOR-1 bacterium RIFOXYA12_FULL_43_27]OGC19278.1 MAG: hypothetical protein A2292_01060 [candidate division WOR-1 bacterium RIFOXYB2_FULL_46_45]OGC30267.1 MAG: hypothetical protein A2232_01060 [candidate division WOR-1 bacterium RIFOXYA2_FULL_46_56]OGC40868.1 MAG: hypothetical protein A2438_01060 [candidate division WOR-1 bacterium RIFOXYC2_FULL_46_14]
MKSVFLVLIFVFIIILLSSGCKVKGGDSVVNSIGEATMLQDGTIVLNLRGQGEGGMKGDAQLSYPKNHQNYNEILKHLDGLKPGESKPVPPWE